MPPRVPRAPESRCTHLLAGPLANLEQLECNLFDTALEYAVKRIEVAGIIAELLGTIQPLKGKAIKQRASKGEFSIWPSAGQGNRYPVLPAEYVLERFVDDQKAVVLRWPEYMRNTLPTGYTLDGSVVMLDELRAATKKEVRVTQQMFQVEEK
jgi:hypothetical protein